MKQKRFEFLLRAEQPIAQGKETIGNISILNTTPIVGPKGRIVNVPCVSGDALRHGLREASTYALLDAAGLLTDGLSEGALRLLFAGGSVGGSNATIDLKTYHALVDLLPPLGLLGGCAGNRMQPGRLEVDEALLVCHETRHMQPAWIMEHLDSQSWETPSYRAYIEEPVRVRMDPTLDPAKRALLAAGDQGQVQERLLVSELASATDDAALAAKSKSTMLPRSHQRVARGSLWWWGVTANIVSDLDEDTFHVMVAAFLRRAIVGGKRGTGHGLLAPVRAQNIDLGTWQQRAESMRTDLGAAVGSLFRAHVSQRTEKIRELLREVEA